MDNIRVNEGIKAPKLRVIDEEGEQYGILSIEEALKLAEEKGLDLVEVSAKTDPPVAKLMDYGKYKYQISKKQHEAKKKQTVVKVKEIKIRPKTGEHDIKFKAKNAQNFLVSGNKVKVTIQYKGREMVYAHLGIEMLNRFANEVKDFGEIEQAPVNDGRVTFIILTPIKSI